MLKAYVWHIHVVSLGMYYSTLKIRNMHQHPCNRQIKLRTHFCSILQAEASTESASSLSNGVSTPLTPSVNGCLYRHHYLSKGAALEVYVPHSVQITLQGQAYSPPLPLVCHRCHNCWLAPVTSQTTHRSPTAAPFKLCVLKKRHQAHV